jgi:sec-independent protein translocase protein TatA
MNVGDLFDSWPKILIIAVVIIVLFGSKKLPGAARSLGQSMRILKREVQGLHEDESASGPSESTATGVPAPAEIAASQQPDQQGQIEALQQQIRDLQRASTMDTPAPAVQAGASAESPRTQQPS